MVSKTRRGRRSTAKRHYTKRRVYRNKHAQKSYRVKRGGAWGKYNDCTKICDELPAGEKKSMCYKGCQSAFPSKKDGSELPNNFPDARNYE
jgi:hypothetical protein